jgi:hypothetical protein
MPWWGWLLVYLVALVGALAFLYGAGGDPKPPARR